MPYMSDAARSVAANAVATNVLAGKAFEFIQRPSFIEIGSVGSAAGLLITIMAGSRIIVQDEEISSANRWPIDPDDFVYRFPAAPGERLVINFRNRTAGALTVNTQVKITEVG